MEVNMDDIADMNKKNLNFDQRLSQVTTELNKLKLKHEEVLTEK